jgi:hypothetical protein
MDAIQCAVPVPQAEARLTDPVGIPKSPPDGFLRGTRLATTAKRASHRQRCSRRPRRHLLFDAGLGGLFGHVEIVAGLEVRTDSQGSVGGDRPAAEDDVVDPRPGHFDRPGQGLNAGR